MKNALNTETAPASPEKTTLTLQEVADVLGVSYLTAWRLVHRGFIGTLPGLRHKLVPRAELDRYVASGVKS